MYKICFECFTRKSGMLNMYSRKMNKKEKIIAQLNMIPLPDEGGYFVQTYKSSDIISQDSHPFVKGDRATSTAIYYLLGEFDISKFHVLNSDEAWHFYSGDKLTLVTISPDGCVSNIKMGSEILDGDQPQHIVKKGYHFGAYIDEKDIDQGYVLIGCTVSPGFEFEDFELSNRDELLSIAPSHNKTIDKLLGLDKISMNHSLRV